MIMCIKPNIYTEMAYSEISTLITSIYVYIYRHMNFLFVSVLITGVLILQALKGTMHNTSPVLHDCINTNKNLVGNLYIR